MKIINAPALHRDTRARAVRERDARFHVAINLGDDRAVKVFPARTFRRETHVLRETRYATIGRQLFDPSIPCHLALAYAPHQGKGFFL